MDGWVDGCCCQYEIGQEWPYLGDLNFVALLEMLGKGVNELFGGDILNIHSVGVVDQSKLNLKSQEVLSQMHV